MTQWGVSISTAAEASFAVFTVGRNLTSKTTQEERFNIITNSQQKLNICHTDKMIKKFGLSC